MLTHIPEKLLTFRTRICKQKSHEHRNAEKRHLQTGMATFGTGSHCIPT
ncbi:hypothetical protein GJU90_06580 [Brucella sp. 10RB9210]|nr:hypothetical protein [Brucella sp. 10RB9210]